MATYELKVIPTDMNKNYFEEYIKAVKNSITTSKTLLVQSWEAPQRNEENINSLPPKLKEIAKSHSPHQQYLYGQGYPSTINYPPPNYNYPPPTYQPIPQPLPQPTPQPKQNPRGTPIPQHIQIQRGGGIVPIQQVQQEQLLLQQQLQQQQQQQQQQLYPGITNYPTYPLPKNDNSFIDYPKINHNSNNPNILDLDVPIHLRKYIPIPKKEEEKIFPSSFPGYAVQQPYPGQPYGQPHFDPYPVKKCMPPMPYFDGEIVLENEVGEFFEVPGFSDIVDFTKEWNNIHYTKAS
jgi:hypothetical protein